MTASRTMILLDPDLSSPRSTPRGASPQSEKDARLPSVRALTLFLRKARAAVRLKGQVTVLLTSDEAIRRLNRQFRGKNKTTDVLSFPAMQGPGTEEMAGDLAISVPTASKQAGEQGHPLATEIKVLILHGLLHLAGYDHETDEGQMARRERLLRARLNLPLGLIERAGKGSSPEAQRTHRALSLRPSGSRKSAATGARVGNKNASSAKSKNLRNSGKRSANA